MVAQAVRVAMAQVVLGVREDQGVQAREAMAREGRETLEAQEAVARVGRQTPEAQEAMAPMDPVDQEVKSQMDHQETHQVDLEQADPQDPQDPQEVDPPG